VLSGLAKRLAAKTLKKEGDKMSWNQEKWAELKRDMTPYLEDEHKTSITYEDFAIRLRALGATAYALTMRTMASDERQHEKELSFILAEGASGKPIAVIARKGPYTPLPGDIVIVTRSDDTLIKEGAKGVIEGMEGVRRVEYEVTYEVTFNWSPLPWWNEGAITSSGGPSRFIKVSDLVWTGETTDQDFHYWGPRGQGKDLAEIAKHTVRVWEIDLTQPPYASTKRGNLLNFNDFQKKLLDTLAPEMQKYAQENMTALYNDYQSRGEIFDTWVIHLGLSEPRKFRTSEQDQRFKEKLPELMGENSNTYEITKRHIYSLAEKLHLLVYEDQKKQNPKFGEETWQLWSRVVISEKRDWWYIDIHNTRFSVGKYTGDTYRGNALIGKIAQLTADDLFKAM